MERKEHLISFTQAAGEVGWKEFNAAVAALDSGASAEEIEQHFNRALHAWRSYHGLPDGLDISTKPRE